ncbi:MAG: hypothetical protein AB8B65_07095 [Kordia sp.]|uniref:hypothetical protein n=1 Tax=Kordia sp. TaxID=1965332 RepID=UPI00385EA6CE
MSTLNTLVPPQYGITERKKQELDQLTQQVIDAQDTVNQYQAIVDSLTEKSNKLNTQLTNAEANKAQALSNKDLLDTMVNDAKDLQSNSSVTFDAIVLADAKIKTVAEEIKTTINNLIYSAEVINKLANLVIRKKASNPLISDELVTMVTTAGTDANNAVALTLVALQSVFSAQATSLESEAAMALQLLQATKLYELMIGEEVDGIDNKLPIAKEPEDGAQVIKTKKKYTIQSLLDYAYTVTSNMYEEALTASKDTLKQLNDIQSKLSEAQVQLASLQAGLAAANAAALAS